MKETFINIPGFESDLSFAVTLAGISYCDGSYHIRRRSSDICCIEYVMRGTGTVHAQGRVFHPTAGDVYLLLATEDHDYASSSDDPWVKIWVNVKGTLVDALIDAYGLRGQTLFTVDAYDYFVRMHEVLSCHEGDSSHIMERVSLIFHELLQLLARHIAHPANQSEAHSMREYINAHVYEPLSLDALSRLVCKSTAQTIRTFKRAYGITPYEYYTNLRLKKAVALLRYTQLPVKDIAYRLHFCDEHYFSSVIRKHTGCAPAALRRGEKEPFSKKTL